jgi:hypothetical protein
LGEGCKPAPHSYPSNSRLRKLHTSPGSSDMARLGNYTFLTPERISQRINVHTAWKEQILPGFSNTTPFAPEPLRFCALAHPQVLSWCKNTHHLTNIGVLILILKENMPLLHRGLVYAPQHSHDMRRRAGDDERIEGDLGVSHSLFNLLDRFVELDLR